MPTQSHPLAASAGISIAASLLGASLVPAGGLAFALLAGMVACAVAPLAVASWRSRDHHDPVATAAGDVATALLLATVLGPLAASSAVGTLAVAGAWLASWAIGPRAIPATAALWLLGMGFVAASAVGQPLATALLPVPGAKAPAVASAVVLGVLLAGLGTVGWSTRLPRVPGDRGTPWVVAGIGVLTLLGIAVAAAARYSASDGASLALPAALVLALGATGPLAWSAATAGHRGRLLAGGSATAWVAASTALGATSVAALVADVLLPWLMAAGLARRAQQTAGRLQAALGGTAAVLFVAGLASLRPPASVTEAIGIGGLAVAGFWGVMVSATGRALAEGAR